jgi:hypothetical protein
LSKISSISDWILLCFCHPSVGIYFLVEIYEENTASSRYVVVKGRSFK